MVSAVMVAVGVLAAQADMPVSVVEAPGCPVRLERPKVSVISTHHFINHGGAEVVVYRATPDDITSGVVVGDVEYPGYPAATAGVASRIIARVKSCAVISTLSSG